MQNESKFVQSWRRSVVTRTNDDKCYVITVYIPECFRRSPVTSLDVRCCCGHRETAERFFLCTLNRILTDKRCRLSSDHTRPLTMMSAAGPKISDIRNATLNEENGMNNVPLRCIKLIRMSDSKTAGMLNSAEHTSCSTDNHGVMLDVLV
jgi:hypothetical protein